MAKPVFVVLLFNMLFAAGHAQKGIASLGIRASAPVPLFQQDRGFGFSLIGAYGISQSGQLTLSAGFSKWKATNSIETGDVTTRIVPVLIGYKQALHQFFIEPRLGIGELGGTIVKNGDRQRPSVAALFGAVNAGYTFQRFTAGIGFLTAHGIENSSAGIWYNKNVHYTSIFVGYTLWRSRGH
jgi:hypothetical protein